MPTFPSSILTQTLIDSGSPIKNPAICTPKGFQVKGAVSNFDSGDRQSIVTQATRSNGSVLPIGYQFDCEFWLDAAQFVVWDVFADEVGYGDVAKRFDIPTPLFWQPNFPTVMVNRFVAKFKVGSTPMKWRFVDAPQFPANPISNPDRGYYDVKVTIESMLPF